MEEVKRKDGAQYPATVTDMLARWDAGKGIWSVEMGGLGPGYEQAIQVGIVELCRKMDGKPTTVKAFDHDAGEEVEKFHPDFDEALHEVDREMALGLSGAQAGAIKGIAHQFLSNGPRAALLKFQEEGMESDRLIQVDNNAVGKPRDAQEG